MSQDVYQLDREHHGGIHVDRYNRQGHKVGRYLLDKTPMSQKGITPPPVPKADFEKFEAALGGRRSRN